MRLSELAGKEIINLSDGSRLGVVGDSDLLIDPESGEIASLILPPRWSLWGFFSSHGGVVVPWKAVKRVGTEVVVVELDSTYTRGR